MKTRMLLASLALCGVILAGPALAQEQDQEAMMKAYMEMMKLGPAHNMLAQLEGDWTYNMISYENPEAPMKMTGTATKKMVMDGRYLREDFKGDYMGMPFTGVSISGYNNTTKKFESMWFDSMSTGLMLSHGEYAEGNTMTMFSEHANPMTGEMMNVKMVTEIVDDTKHIFRSYVVKDGEEIKQMEIEYVRK